MAGPGKKMIPAPIDRPLSRAYLRQFTGMSTAYPPGMSDPTSVRVMENMIVNRDGSMRIRPGLRHLSYTELPGDEGQPGIGFDRPVVGSHEVFFLNDGSKAYLFACREADDAQTVGFRVLSFTGETAIVRELTDAGVDFDIPQGEEVLNFSSGTTYVKYLQIDNKIYALSDNGETMRRFDVSSAKSAKKLNAIVRPNWDVADKLTVVQPEAIWLTGGSPVAVRTNLVPNQAFKDNTSYWGVTGAPVAGAPPSPLLASATRVAKTGVAGKYAMRLTSLPQRTNLAAYPLQNTNDGSELGWYKGFGANRIQAFSVGLTVTSESTYAAGHNFQCYSFLFSGVTPGVRYSMGFDLTQETRLKAGTFLSGLEFYTAAGVAIGAPRWETHSNTLGRKSRVLVTAPSGAAYVRVHFSGEVEVSNQASSFSVKNINVCREGESTAMFHGSSGTNYFWVGAAGASASVYHPPAQVVAYTAPMPVVAGQAYTAQGELRAVSGAMDGGLAIVWLNSSSAEIATEGGAAITETTSSWTQATVLNEVAPVGATQARVLIGYTDTIARGEYHDISNVLMEQSTTLEPYFDGTSVSTSTLKYAVVGLTVTETEYALGVLMPTPETPTDNTLISDGDPNKNEYNVGFFYTFANEVGETYSSQVTVVKVQRPWAGWKWQLPNVAGEPDPAAPTDDPDLCADQLIAYMTEAVFDAAKEQGAIEWNLYMMTWSDQSPVPVQAIKVDTREIRSDSTWGAAGWGRMTPQLADLSADIAPIPNFSARFNYSDPSAGGNGLVAADRMVMVLDPREDEQARIRWSSNQQGDYSNFTASRGGGYKTLTSGNLMIPACVKLWQNPQSADTLTILCMGVDGRSTGYYMAPAQVSSQSDATSIMGFEETTATPGTVAPYGVEVFNNSLYHPLDTELMKSTASNYNINHKSMTDQIENIWRRLQFKNWIVSAQHNNRLYYIVNNPDGAPLEEGCRGNEIWVFDGGSEKGTWSRFLIQAISLREIEQGGRTYMSVVRPDGLFYLDPAYAYDDIVDAEFYVGSTTIPWKMETNTQGANRAHDAWCNLQQLVLMVGNFTGSMRYGVRGLDINGQWIDKSKEMHDLNPAGLTPWDFEDALLIQRELKEWSFYAESITESVDIGEGVFEDQVLPSSGQLNVIQYRYTPISVNVGYEHGAIETFEYSSGRTDWGVITTNGIPVPMVDTRRP